MPPKNNTKTETKALLPEKICDESPVRHILCVKNKVHMKQYEETDDCFILDFDPYDENIDPSKLNVDKEKCGAAADDDICIVAEKGQVACRDYPHPRDLCLKFPFQTTPHKEYCELCYCYICDSAAPCKDWIDARLPHCDATGSVLGWNFLREEIMQNRKVKKRQIT